MEFILPKVDKHGIYEFEDGYEVGPARAYTCDGIKNSLARGTDYGHCMKWVARDYDGNLIAHSNGGTILFGQLEAALRHLHGLGKGPKLKPLFEVNHIDECNFYSVNNNGRVCAVFYYGKSHPDVNQNDACRQAQEFIDRESKHLNPAPPKGWDKVETSTEDVDGAPIFNVVKKIVSLSKLAKHLDTFIDGSPSFVSTAKEMAKVVLGV